MKPPEPSEESLFGAETPGDPRSEWPEKVEEEGPATSEAIHRWSNNNLSTQELEDLIV